MVGVGTRKMERRDGVESGMRGVDDDGGDNSPAMKLPSKSPQFECRSKKRSTSYYRYSSLNQPHIHCAQPILHSQHGIRLESGLGARVGHNKEDALHLNGSLCCYCLHSHLGSHDGHNYDDVGDCEGFVVDDCYCEGFGAIGVGMVIEEEMQMDAGVDCVVEGYA